MGGKRRGTTEETRTKRITECSSSEAVPKRQRVSRACDQCRAAREKCDGIQPLCFPCASQNRSCSWQEPKKKRGVQTGYIRTLELALGWIFDKIPESENSLHGLLTHQGGQGRLLLAGKDTAAGNRLHRRWRKSTVHTEIERVLSGDTASTGSANGSTPGGESDEDVPEKDLPMLQDTGSVISVLEPIVSTNSDRELTDRTNRGHNGMKMLLQLKAVFRSCLKVHQTSNPPDHNSRVPSVSLPTIGDSLTYTSLILIYGSQYSRSTSS